MDVTIYFVLHGKRHSTSEYSELSAFGQRYNLQMQPPSRAVGNTFTITDLGFDQAEEYRPYQLDAQSMSHALGLLSAELAFHDAIAILRHPDRYNPRKDQLLTTDTALAAEMSQAGFAAVAVQPDQPELLGRVLEGSAAEDISAEVDGEMFQSGGPLRREQRAVPEAMIPEKAAPFPVVLARGALVAGRTDHGAPKDVVTLMDQLIASMGGTEYDMHYEGDVLIGGVYESSEIAMDCIIVPSLSVDVGHPGPFIEFEQTFAPLPYDTDAPPEATVDQGVRQLAQRIGMCLAIEGQYDASDGWLVGYSQQKNETLAPVRVRFDEEAAEGGPSSSE